MNIDVTKMQREEKTVFGNVKTTSDGATGVYDVVKRGLDVTVAFLGMSFYRGQTGRWRTGHFQSGAGRL